jgi:hypothetical protein
MKMFTKLWQWMMILLISSSVLIVQAQKDVSSGKAKAKAELKQEIKAQFNEEQLNFLEKSGLMEEVLFSGKELDPEVMLKLMEMSGYDKTNPFESNNNGSLIDVVGTYTFSQTTGTYTEITGGTLLGTATNDDQRFVDPALPAGGTTTTGPGFPIGFNFTFDDVVFDRVAINSNGWISLGQSALTPSVNNASTSAYTPIGSTTAITPVELVGRIVALGRDLQGQTGSELRIETIGVSPNQECVIQWKSYRKYNNTGDDLNFQIRLLENANVVKLVYGTMTNNATSTTVQVGLRAAPATTATNFANRSTATDWNATTAGAINTASCTLSSTVYPASGLTFIYTPPEAGTPLPPANPNPANAALGVPVSGSLTWDFGTNTATYDLWFGPAGGMTQVVSGGSAGASGSYAYSGLAYTSNYQWQVIAYNGALVTNGPVWNFTTVCGSIVTLPWIEDFEGLETVGAKILPLCWSYENVVGTSGPTSSSTTGTYYGPNSGTKFFYMHYANTTWAFTPGISLTIGTSYDFSFYMMNKYITSPVDFVMDVAYGSTQNSAGMTNVLATGVVCNNNTYVLFKYTIVPAVSGDYYFGVKTTSATTTPWYVSFDDFRLELTPACPNPQSLGVTAVTGVSADLTWTSFSGLSDIEFGIFGFTPTGVPTYTGVTSPYNVGSLSPQTQYSFYVRDDCGGGDYSNWTGPYSFYTLCGTSTSFTENFDGLVTPAIPNCWTKLGGGSAYTWTSYNYSPPNGVYIYGYSGAVPVLTIQPLSNAGANTHQLRFWARSNYTTGAIIEVGYMTNPADPLTFTLIQSFTTTLTFAEFTCVPGTAPGSNQVLAFRQPASPAYSATIDNVVWEPLPACPNPIQLGATNITTTQADLTWSSYSGLSDIEFGVAGFTPTGVPTDAGKTSPYTKGGLSASSSYSFYVRDDCGGGTYSNWVGPYTFFTPCDVVSLPYSQSFPTSAFPNCWTEQLTGLITSSHWSMSNTNLAGGTAYEARAYYSPGQGSTQDDNDRLVTPALNTTGLTSIKVSFRQFLDDYLASPTGGVWIKVQSSANGTTWTDEWVYAGGFGIDIPAEVKELTITNNLGATTYIAWTLSGYTFNINYWYVDDVVISVPLAHDVAAVSVDIPSMVEPGSVNPAATVKNVGLNAETFNVNMTIGAYSNTKSVTLNPGASTQVTFDPWNAVVGSYTATVCTQLAGDLDPTNNCVSKSVSVEVLRKMYGYVAYANTSGLPEGPCYFYAQYPGTIYSLGATTSEEFIGAGTWANDVWYGSEYYDESLLTGGGWWTINSTTGAMTLLGDYNIGFAGITYNPTSGIMYGTRWNATNLNSELYTINIATGAPTLVGVFSTQLIINLASDGTNYLYGFSVGDDNLYRIDPAVPSATLIGYAGFDFNYAQDLEWDFENNVMYAAAYNYTTSAGQLMTVNMTTGACTLIGNFMGNAEITGFAIPYTLGYKVSGNVYYGHTGIGKPMATNTTVTLSPHGTTSTTTGGYYEFISVADGNYTLGGNSSKPYGGLQALDAIQVQRFVAGAVTFTSLQRRAGDVNMSSSVQNLDATFIRRRVGSIAVPQWTAPNWIFDGPFGTPPALQGLPVTVSGSNVSVELRTLCSGDVNNSYTPPAE